VKVLTVVGARPQIIKAAAVSGPLRRAVREVLVHTGQHYDPGMSDQFFRELDVPSPDHHLGIGSGPHGVQTGRMLATLEPVMESERPDRVLVYGDTNSTLAGALAAAKLGIRVAHVEAGLRSFDRSMPEEVNRVVADHLSRWLFAPTPTAVANLAAEGIVDGISLVGDLMQDLAARLAAGVRDPAALAATGLGVQPGAYLFATVHRAENRQPAAMHAWAALLDSVAAPDRPVILALHPGTQAALAEGGITPGEHVRVVEPQGYRTTLALQLHAAAVLTDSGGVQREAAWLGVPCLVLRDRTEWVEAVETSDGRMVLVGLDAACALDELGRLAPRETAPADASRRAAGLDLRPAGAAEAIASALDAAEH
jgi:UDP-N-acetylglucosamine 2-epimerase